MPVSDWMSLTTSPSVGSQEQPNDAKPGLCAKSGEHVGEPSDSSLSYFHVYISTFLDMAMSRPAPTTSPGNQIVDAECASRPPRR